MASTPLTWDSADTQGNPLLWDSALTWDGVQPQPAKRMPQLHVLLNFLSGSDKLLQERSEAVLQKLYTSDLWTVPPNQAIPVTEAALTTGINDFTASIAVAGQGGPPDTAKKNGKREALILLMRQLATYVQDNHGNDLAKLLASGFEAASTNRASGPLDAPSITDIINGMSGQLILRITPVANTKVYEARYALIGPGGTPGPWQTAPLFQSTRNMAVNGLTPGSVYQFQVRAVGGSTGYSDWSDPVSHMSL